MRQLWETYPHVVDDLQELRAYASVSGLRGGRIPLEPKPALLLGFGLRESSRGHSHPAEDAVSHVRPDLRVRPRHKCEVCGAATILTDACFICRRQHLCKECHTTEKCSTLKHGKLGLKPHEWVRPVWITVCAECLPAHRAAETLRKL